MIPPARPSVAWARASATPWEALRRVRHHHPSFEVAFVLMSIGVGDTLGNATGGKFFIPS